MLKLTFESCFPSGMTFCPEFRYSEGGDCPVKFPVEVSMVISLAFTGFVVVSTKNLQNENLLFYSWTTKVSNNPAILYLYSFLCKSSLGMSTFSSKDFFLRIIFLSSLLRSPRMTELRKDYQCQSVIESFQNSISKNRSLTSNLSRCNIWNWNAIKSYVIFLKIIQFSNSFLKE